MGPLFLAFTLIPLLELFLLIRIGRVIGAPSTILLVVLTGIAGAWLAKRQGRKVLDEWREALAMGRVPEEGVLGGMLVLLGGLLLITPGVITDFAGLFCLLPATRKLLAHALQRKLARQVELGRAHVFSYGFGGSRPRSPSDGRPPFDNQDEPPRIRRDDVIDTEGEELK